MTLPVRAYLSPYNPSLCTNPQYQFVYLDYTTSPASPSVFRDWGSYYLAYWDTHNIAGYDYVYVAVRDANSPNQVDGTSSWTGISLQAHGYPFFDSRLDLNDQYVQTYGDVSIGSHDPWIVQAEVGYEPSANAPGIDSAGYASALTPYLSAYSQGIIGYYGQLENDFVQVGYYYDSTGNGVFAETATEAALTCLLGYPRLIAGQGTAISGNTTLATTYAAYKSCYVPQAQLGLQNATYHQLQLRNTGSLFDMIIDNNIISSQSESSNGNQVGMYDVNVSHEANVREGTYPVSEVGFGGAMNAGMSGYYILYAVQYWNDTQQAWLPYVRDGGYVFINGSAGQMSEPAAYCNYPFDYRYSWASYHDLNSFVVDETRSSCDTSQT
jgi:hypothetical protein